MILAIVLLPSDVTTGAVFRTMQTRTLTLGHHAIRLEAFFFILDALLLGIETRLLALRYFTRGNPLINPLVLILLACIKHRCSGHREHRHQRHA
ncbi:MAG: hypothetical protein IPH50_09375 [Rhodanobacteraceae bacterium]|nr:hypothetical protein [Rhodanobacteraceae bacterium]